MPGESGYMINDNENEAEDEKMIKNLIDAT